MVTSAFDQFSDHDTVEKNARGDRLVYLRYKTLVEGWYLDVEAITPQKERLIWEALGGVNLPKIHPVVPRAWLWWIDELRRDNEIAMLEGFQRAIGHAGNILENARYWYGKHLYK